MASNAGHRQPIDFFTPRLLDGAMGTELLKRGWSYGTCLESWAVENLQVIGQVHREYIAAGAEIINTCTFGANRIRLDAFGMGERVRDLNRQLVRTAITARKQGTLIAGNIGPTGQSKTSGGDLTPTELEKVFAEQALLLEQAGVDLIAVESMTDLEEARAALNASVAATALPVTVSLAFDENCCLRDGVDPETVCEELQSHGASAIGCNCWPDGDALYQVIARTKKVAEVPLMAQPSAGLPTDTDGSLAYPLSAAGFVLLVQQLMDAGAVMIGGCCGTTPEYIRLLRRSLTGT